MYWYILSEQLAAFKQGNHNKCHEGSRCKSEGYVMSKKMLTEARAIAAYKKAITSTIIYRHAADYMWVTHSCSWTVVQ